MNHRALEFYGHYLSVPACKVGLMLSLGGISPAGDTEIDLSPWPNIGVWRARMKALEGCGDMGEIMPEESRA